MAGSIPSMNIDLFQSNQSQGPVTRSTITNHSQTNYDALGGIGPHHGYVNLRASGGISAAQESCGPHRSTDSIANSLGLNVMPSHHSQESSNGRTAEDNTFPPTGSFDNQIHVENWLAEQQDPGVSSTTRSQTGRLMTDAVPFEPSSMEANCGGGSSRFITEDQRTHLEAPPIISKTEGKPTEEIIGDIDTAKLNVTKEPGYIHVTGANGHMNVNIRGTRGAALQIGDNNVMTVIQQRAGANKIHVRQGDKHHAKPKPQKKVTLQVPKRLVSDEDMDIVAANIGRDWRRLGTKLSLTSGEIESLQYDYNQSGHQEVVFQMIRKWKSNHGPEATIRFLAKALVDVKRPDIAKKFTTE